jgi:hypothetical protein
MMAPNTDDSLAFGAARVGRIDRSIEQPHSARRCRRTDARNVCPNPRYGRPRPPFQAWRDRLSARRPSRQVSCGVRRKSLVTYIILNE